MDIPAVLPIVVSPVRKWGMLVVLSLALAVIILDTTILNVALASIIRDLQTDIQSIQWVITAYSLTLASFTITGGRMGDIFGKKRMFMFGAVLFAVGSFIASVSMNVPMLIAGESIIEGIGAALMMPATASLLVENFFGRERAIAFGVWGGIAGASAALGPILGGYLATNYSWRWGFRVNLIVVGLLIIGSLLIPKVKILEKKPRLDFVGVLLSATGMFSLVFGLIESSTYGWWKAKAVFTAFDYLVTPWWGLSVVPIFILVGFIILGIFLTWEALYEKRGKIPLVSLGLFKNRTFTSGIATTAIMSLGQTGLIFSLPVFLQSVRGLDAYHTGLSLLPMSLSLLVVAPLSAILSKKISPKVLIALGLFINCLAYVVLYHTLNLDTTSHDLMPGLALFGIGMGFVMSQVNNITLSAVKPQQAGEASGLNATLRQVGSTLGSAIMGAILIGALGSQMAGGVDSSTVIPSELKPILASAMQTQSSNVEFGGGAHINGQLSDDVKTEVLRIGHQATVDASKQTLAFGGLFAFLGFLSACILLPGKKRIAKDDSISEVVSSVPSRAFDTSMIGELIALDASRIASGKPGIGDEVRVLIDGIRADSMNSL
ncbi:MAG: MFS transporter [Patescibacteria group bacterium]|jgi:EmrB/QacA subfamily drug resistance transporter